MIKQYKTILIGGGGHALSLYEATGPDPSIFKGYTAFEPNPELPLDYLGTDSDICSLLNECAVHIAFVYARKPVMAPRREIINRFADLGAIFATIIAGSAIVTPNSKIGPGCAFLNGCIVNRANLEDNVIVNSGAIVEHGCQIGSNTFIGPGAVIGGGVTIGRDSFIGLGARIRNGLTLPPHTTVPMGATIIRAPHHPND